MKKHSIIFVMIILSLLFLFGCDDTKTNPSEQQSNETQEGIMRYVREIS